MRMRVQRGASICLFTGAIALGTAGESNAQRLTPAMLCSWSQVHAQSGSVNAQSAFAPYYGKNRIHYDNAITVFSNVVSVSAPASEPWWIARFMIAQAHYRRGQGKDIITAKTMIKMLRDNYPSFDENKYGMKDRFEELEKQIASGGH